MQDARVLLLGAAKENSENWSAAQGDAAHRKPGAGAAGLLIDGPRIGEDDPVAARGLGLHGHPFLLQVGPHHPPQAGRIFTGEQLDLHIIHRVLQLGKLPEPGRVFEIIQDHVLLVVVVAAEDQQNGRALVFDLLVIVAGLGNGLVRGCPCRFAGCLGQRLFPVVRARLGTEEFLVTLQ